MTRLTIGIDTGGTFTDVFAVDENGRTWKKKVPSTPADFSTCFVNGVEAILKEQPTGRIDLFLHGTTVATNALLEDQLPRVGLIVTKGFREILETTRYSSHEDAEGEPSSHQAPRLVRSYSCDSGSTSDDRTTESSLHSACKSAFTCKRPRR